MDALKHYVRLAFVLLILGASAAGLYNVFGDTPELVATAKQAACPGSLCGLRKLDRSAIAQTFEFDTPKGEPIVVRCAREAVFVGAYACKRQ